MINRANRFISPRAAEAFVGALPLIKFKPNGEILDANEPFLTAMGYSRSEVVGAHHRMFVGADRAGSREYAEFWHSLARGDAQHGEFLRFAKDGSAVWIEAYYTPVQNRRGEVVEVMKVAFDITKRKEQESAQSEVLTSLKSSQAVIEFDSKGQILTANELFLGVMGYQLAEVLGKHHRIFMPPGKANERSYDQFWLDLRRGQPQQGEFERVNKQGESVFIQAIYTPIVSADGSVQRIVKFATDITDQVEGRRLEEVAGQLAESIAGLVESSSHIHGGVGDTAQRSQSLVHSAEDARSQVRDLGQESQRINAIVSLIRSLADQTNLLALNATVEAVRAGEAGAGFNVVASEVKKLANETTEALAGIGSQVGGILELIESVGTTIDGMYRESTKVDDNAKEIARAMEQQTELLARLHESSQSLAQE